MKRSGILCLLVIGCGTSSLPAPTIESIQPNTTEASASTDVAVKINAVLPFHADYDAPDSGVDQTLNLVIGNVTLARRYVDGGVLAGTIPSILAPGDYDVSLVLADGRQAVLDGGFHVTAGNWPTSYTIDKVPNQKARKPFEITVHANGANGPTFHGNVSLQSLRGGLTPSLSDAFDGGVLVQQVSVDQPSQNYIIGVYDSAGHFGLSNAFDVAP